MNCPCVKDAVYAQAMRSRLLFPQMHLFSVRHLRCMSMHAFAEPSITQVGIYLYSYRGRPRPFFLSSHIPSWCLSESVSQPRVLLIILAWRSASTALSQLF